MKSIKDLEKKYDLELDKVISEIKSKKAKLVLLQFPDGLKPYATAIVDYLEDKLAPNRVGPEEGVPPKSGVGGKFLIWLESCYGACDTPVGIDNIKPKIDLVVQFGHNEMIPRI